MQPSEKGKKQNRNERQRYSPFVGEEERQCFLNGCRVEAREYTENFWKKTYAPRTARIDNLKTQRV